MGIEKSFVTLQVETKPIKQVFVRILRSNIFAKNSVELKILILVLPQSFFVQMPPDLLTVPKLRSARIINEKIMYARAMPT